MFTTLVIDEVLWLIKTECKAQVLDMFGTFVHPLEEELGIKSNHRVGRFSDVILAGVWHSGKTPSSLYLAMQYGLKAANYPLVPEDFSAAVTLNHKYTLVTRNIKDFEGVANSKWIDPSVTN